MIYDAVHSGDIMDQLSELYEEFIEDRYDCMDRVVLNAYFYSGQYPAGFRTWWRGLCGSDEDLDTNHLMRLAGRFSRRLRAFAKERGIPVMYCGAKADKFEISAEFLKSHTGQPGLFLILVSRAPAVVWEVEKTPAGKIANLRRKRGRASLCSKKRATVSWRSPTRPASPNLQTPCRNQRPKDDCAKCATVGFTARA